MVEADEDIEIINVNDPAVWAAFRFWSYYGVSPDYENTVEQTYTTSGTQSLSGTFTFVGNFSGSFDASVSLTFTGTIETPDGIGNTYYSTSQTSYLMHDDDGYSNITIDITPSANGATNDYNATYACTYYPNTTASVSTMTCTPDYSTNSQPLTLPNMEAEVNGISINARGSETTNLVLDLLHDGTVVGSLNGSLGMSGGGSGSLSLSGTENSTTTTTNHTKYSFTLPIGKTSNNRIGAVDYNIKMLFRGSADDPWVEAWLSTNGLQNYIKLYRSNGNAIDSSLYTKVLRDVAPWMSLEFFEYKGTNDAWMNFTRTITFDGLYPLYSGPKSAMSDDMYRFIYKGDRTIDAIDTQTAADQQHHEEMMDTSDSSKISTDGNALVEDADEKFGDLFFPLQHAVDTAHDLANVDATGVIRLPAIFKDDYWYLDLTVIERNLPQAWTFIQSLCQLAVAIYMIKGLYNLFFGGGKEDDS